MVKKGKYFFKEKQGREVGGPSGLKETKETN